MNPEGTVYNAQGRINRLSVLVIDAYGVALKNGFKGTVEEWLASLKGEKGDIGEAFTYEDFTEEQLEALKGANGFSPIVQVFPKAEVIRYPDGTMVTKEIGYTIRITDSEGYQDIDILHGEKGEKGKDGTMTFEDLTDEQRESLRGDPGKKGDPGDSGVYILSEGETLEDAPADVDVVYDPFFDTEVIPGGGIDVEGAVPGQTIAVKTVDANGKPTAWEAVDFPEGGGAKAFYITITGEDGVYTADKTVEELNEAYNAGCALYAMVTAQIENFAVTNSVWTLANASDSWYVFSTIENRHFLSAFITSRGVSMHIQKLAAAADIPTALPNPNALTLTGAVEATYDGSGAVNVEIPVIAGEPGKDGYTPIKGVDYFDGEDGYTPVKGVDYFDGKDGEDGTSVTVKSVTESTADGGSNVVEFSDGKTVTIKNGKTGGKGDPGSNGSNGVSCTHAWNGTTLSVTSASGTSSANLKGEKGDKGDKGDTGSDGKTPVKGTDYWTSADRSAMVSDVLAALPTWNGGS